MSVSPGLYSMEIVGWFVTTCNLGCAFTLHSIQLHDQQTADCYYMLP